MKQEINGGERLLKKNKLLVNKKNNWFAYNKVSKNDTDYWEYISFHNYVNYY